MRYEDLITKFCPLVRETCRGQGCVAYNGDDKEGRCSLFWTSPNAEVAPPAPVTGDSSPAA